MPLGLVCAACDALSPINATVCQMCGSSLGVARTQPINPIGTAQRPAVTPPAAVPASATARNCEFCGAEMIPGHRFCGNCGKPAATAAAAGAPAPAPQRSGP